MVEDFRALAEATAPDGAPRYRERPVLEDLARFLVRGGGGPNRDTAFYELCHLVNAVDASENGRDRRNAFFLAPERASPGRFRSRLDQAVAKGGWRRGGFTRADEGVAIQYPDGAFTVRFGRMPFLAAVYEFLSGMEDFSFYGELQAIFDEMTAGPADVKAVQAASNRIAGHFRQYRRRHLAPIRLDGKFELIFGFLAERAPAGRVTVDDAAVLDFWSEKSATGDFRSYRTVFDAFVHFLRALDEAGHAEALARAASIGVDREHGEVEPDDSGDDLADTAAWVSPLDVLDQEPAAAIKFLKKESERKPVETLMQYGPAAIRLPLAFLRLESFGPIQSAITTDLQIGRGLDRVQSRVTCADAVSYGGIVAGFGGILEIVRRLQKAAFYALHTDSQRRAAGATVVPLRREDSIPCFDAARTSAEDVYPLPEQVEIERLAADAAKAFRAISRKGFDEAGLRDESRIEGFRLAAGALVMAGRQIERYLAAAGRLERGEQNLEGRFDADRRAFSKKFCSLYGVTQ
ncbi:MAG: hypothetical protein ACYCZX_00060 [Rhodospirillaceae bacterium]